MTSAAIYARVSSDRQKKDETIGSQIQELREHAGRSRLDVPEEWIFQDEAHSGETLVRPALEALRDLAAQGCVDVVLCHSPDRLARKLAHQALLIEELARAGTRVEFVKGPRGDSPKTSCWCSSWAYSPSTSGPRSWSGTAAARPTGPGWGR